MDFKSLESWNEPQDGNTVIINSWWMVDDNDIPLVYVKGNTNFPQCNKSKDIAHIISNRFNKKYKFFEIVFLSK